MNIIRKFVENQRHPSGFMGKLAALRMIRGNAEAVEWAVNLLDLKENDQVLEVGFGPGVGIERAAALAARGRVAGVDSSPTMLAMARKRNDKAIVEGRVDLRLGDASSMPFPDNSFDKAFAVNVLYFFEDPVSSLREIHRVLKPGGRAALFVVGAEVLASQGKLMTDVYRGYNAEELMRLLSEAGFQHVSYRLRFFRWSFFWQGRGICAIAVK